MPNDHFLYFFAGASWSSIFAGVISALAIGLVMAIIGLALGFKIVEPKADDPASGLGKTLGLWYALSVLVSISGGAYVAGLFAARLGLEHGFMVWALVTIVLAVCGGHAVGSAVRGLLSALRGLGSGAASLAGAAGSAAGKGVAQAASGVFGQLQEHLQVDLDMDKISEQLNDNVMSVLRDTGSQALQPEHLKQQFREIKGDFRKLARQLALDPTKANKIITDFLDSEKGRLRDLAKEVDKETAVTTLMNNRDIPREEAETMVDNAIEVYEQALDKAKETLADLRQRIEEARDHLKEMADLAREKADQMSNTAAKGAAVTVLAIILAAALSLGFGYLGVQCAQSDWHRSVTIQNPYR